MSPAVILGILLAISVAGNAWQFKHGEGLVKAAAATEQLAKDTRAAADACTAGVKDLSTAAEARQKGLEKALKGVAPEVARLQAGALQAARAKPDDPKDLCGSLQRYLAGQIKAERAKGPQ